MKLNDVTKIFQIAFNSLIDSFLHLNSQKGFSKNHEVFNSLFNHIELIDA